MFFKNIHIKNLVFNELKNHDEVYASLASLLNTVYKV